MDADRHFRDVPTIQNKTRSRAGRDYVASLGVKQSRNQKERAIMRAIDNYTDKEREVLALKGMTAPRTASERNKAKPKIVVRRDMTPDYEREAQRDRDRLQGNKAQHSPLPWRCAGGMVDGYCVVASDNIIVADLRMNKNPDARLIVRAVNHADKLAECLRGVQWKITVYGTHWEPSQAEREAIAATLAAYEAAQ